MNELQIFNHPDFGKVRTFEEDGKVLFCGVDVALVLGYAKPRNALAKHCKGALKRGVPTNGGLQEMVFIPESDLYRLVFRSNLPNAERFTDWVTEEVIPSIRQNGTYALAKTQPMTPAQMLAAQANLLVEMEQKMEAMQNQTLALEAKVDTAIKAFSRPAEDHWRSDMDKAIKELCAQQHLSVTATKGRMYDELEQTSNCNINARLSALRRRKKKNGARHKDAMALNKLDAISADKQLRAIFEGIVRGWQARSVSSGLEAAQ